MSESAGRENVCGECGMPCEPNEYHPYAACLMFKACHNSIVVRTNLSAVANHKLAAVLALADRWDAIADKHGVREFTGNDHRLFANELRALTQTPTEAVKK